MPSSLRHFKSKPRWMHEDNWDGPGYYYYRGNSVWTRWKRRIDINKAKGVCFEL